MTDPKKPGGIPAPEEAAESQAPINPHEGATPAVDASGPQPDTRHELSGSLRKNADAFRATGEHAFAAKLHCVANALDAQAAEIAELKAARLSRHSTEASHEILRGLHLKLRKQNAALREALGAIAIALDVPRNRMGKLETDLASGEDLRLLAQKYEIGGAADVSEQAVKVARAALKVTSDE